MIMKAVLLLSVIMIFLNKLSLMEASTDRWQWSWTCDYRLEQCHRQSSLNVSNTSHYDSLKICRLVCGQYGALWPKPTTSVALQRELVQFHPNVISFDILNADHDAKIYLLDNTKLFIHKVRDECGNNCYKPPNSKVRIKIHIKSSNLSLNWETNESYGLDISSVGPHISVSIEADTVFGARHGLETLSQLFASHPIDLNDSDSLRGLVLINNAKIRDKPVYSHRGLLLDTSRNYLPIRVIKKQIDGMSSVKLNVLHWHATDSQSFPLVSKRVPQMSRYGAYSEDMVYTPSEIEDLLYYAKIRGIRIIMEIDSPAHAGYGWQWGPDYNLGDLAVCVGQTPWKSFCIQPPCGQLNPVNPNLYTVLGSLYNDIIEMFPLGEVFHVGGDEVFIDCWNSSKEIVDYLKKNGKNQSLQHFLDLWGEFHSAALNEFDKIVGNTETPMIIWSSGLTNPDIVTTYLPKERYVIQTWVPSTDKLPEKLIDKGYRLIISTKDAWYLDHGFWGGTQYHTWRTAYLNRLPLSKNVLGGEVCMWGEYVDENALDNKIWPRAAAVAERLWSDPSTDTSKAESRLYAQRERLLARGFKPEVLGPRWCYQNEGLCN